MLSGMPDVARRSAESRVRVGVIGEHQVLTDMSENRDIYRLAPGTDWNARTREVRATAQAFELAINNPIAGCITMSVPGFASETYCSNTLPGKSFVKAGT